MLEAKQNVVTSKMETTTSYKLSTINHSKSISAIDYQSYC